MSAIEVPAPVTDRAEQVEPRDDIATIGSASMSSEPNENDIRVRAYMRYLERGGGHGLHFEDWLEAERELKRRD